MRAGAGEEEIRDRQIRKGQRPVHARRDACQVTGKHLGRQIKLRKRRAAAVVRRQQRRVVGFGGGGRSRGRDAGIGVGRPCRVCARDFAEEAEG